MPVRRSRPVFELQHFDRAGLGRDRPTLPGRPEWHSRQVSHPRSPRVLAGDKNFDNQLGAVNVYPSCSTMVAERKTARSGSRVVKGSSRIIRANCADLDLHLPPIHLGPDQLRQIVDDLADSTSVRALMRISPLTTSSLASAHLGHAKPLFVCDPPWNWGGLPCCPLFYRVKAAPTARSAFPASACAGPAPARSAGRSARRIRCRECSHILGYMLIEVNPGMVLISLMYSLPVARLQQEIHARHALALHGAVALHRQAPQLVGLLRRRGRPAPGSCARSSRYLSS